MKKIKLSLSPEYVKHWTTTDALRELFQNALDHGKFKIEYDKDNRSLRIYSKNAKLKKETLLLGNTTKNGVDTIGQFGEGYKLALLVLTRLGIDVKIYTWDEIWRPKFEHDKDLDCKMLVINIEQTKTRELDLIFEVNGIDNNIYANYVKKNLHLLDKYPEHIRTYKGNLLLGTKFIGCVYINGLYITSLPKFKWGYDFNPGVLKIGRDRNIISEFDLKWNGVDLISKYAEINPEEIISMLEDPKERKKTVDLDYPEHLNSDAKESVTKKLLDKYKSDDTYFYYWESDKKYEGTAVKVSSKMWDIVKNTSAHSKRVKLLKPFDSKDTEEIMGEWLNKNREYMTAKAIESFENFLIPKIAEVIK